MRKELLMKLANLDAAERELDRRRVQMDSERRQIEAARATVLAELRELNSHDQTMPLRDVTDAAMVDMPS